MKINVTQTSYTLDKATKHTTIIVNGTGIQGRAGKDAEFPTNGAIGNLLEQQQDGVRWTNTPTNIKLNGGNF